MTGIPWTDEPGLRTAAADGAELLAHAMLWRPAERRELVTGNVETAAVILGGTFDLTAGDPGGERNSWPARGARQTPFEGRPMAVFLPPGSEFGAADGDGEILLVAARQPDGGPTPQEGRQALSQSPLLPLAGSGKAFDPATGEWMPAETFPTSAESLPPRRMRRRDVGDVPVERVLAADYKAATLTVDEAVIPPGRRLAVAEVDDRPAHREVLVFTRAGGVDTVRVMATPGGAVDCVVEAGAEPVYVLLAYAGK